MRGQPSVGRMVLDNRPWRLVTDLSKLIAATLATAAFALVTSSLWQMADQLGAPRLLLIAVLAVGALAVWLVLANDLWQRPHSSEDTERARRANLATLATLFLGLLLAYLVLFAVVVLVAVLLIPHGYLESNLRHSADFGDYLAITWLICSIATLGGAIGSGFETEEDVRSAILRYRADP